MTVSVLGRLSERTNHGHVYTRCECKLFAWRHPQSGGQHHSAKETIGCLFLSRELRHNMCICRQLFDRRNRDHSVAGGPAHISGGERNFRPGCFRKGRPFGIYAIGRMRIVIY